MNGKNTPVSKTLADLLESRGTFTQDQITYALKACHDRCDPTSQTKTGSRPYQPGNNYTS